MRCLILFLLALTSLTGCVTQADGTKKFDPWAASKKADQSLQEWLDSR